jgi:hypothetical protein
MKVRTIYRLLCMGLAVPAFAGCAVASAGGEDRGETLNVSRQADTLSFVQSVDEASQAIVFQPATSIDWVILHVTIDGSRTTNVGMPATGSSYTIGSLPILPGDTLSYSFTYSVNGQAYDTPQYSHTLSASFVPKAFFTQVASTTTGSEVVVTSEAQLAWADLHYTVNGGTQLNVRLTQQGADYVQPVALHAGDVLRYSATYSTGAAVFDTAVVTYVVGSSGDRFVVDQGTDSTTGLCVANGDSHGQCNLRAAVAAAAAATSPVSIELSVDSTVGVGSMTLASAVVIESAGDGPAHSITGTASGRLFNVAAGAAVTLRNLSIVNFTASDAGAAISNSGAVDLEGVTLSGNRTSCFDVGAMTAIATCTGGAISNGGTLTLGGGTTFENNSVAATAETAAFTTAWSAGGAIANTGTISIVGAVTFSGNLSSATAVSGPHPAPIGGATATVSGGAIYNSGTVVVSGPAKSCQFLQNAATASGSTIYGSATFSSAGGAIENTPSGSLQIPAGACVFSGNSANTGADIDG